MQGTSSTEQTVRIKELKDIPSNKREIFEIPQIQNNVQFVNAKITEKSAGACPLSLLKKDQE